MMSDKAFSESQEEALAKAWDILTEHFDKCVLSIESEQPVESGNAFIHYFHGGRAAAIGLHHMAIHRIQRHKD
jgi:hypothetical protein